jgi:hypothetical protein
MKNKDLKKLILMSDDDKKEHKNTRNRRKRYHQGRIDVYTYLGKKRKNEQ